MLHSVTFKRDVVWLSYVTVTCDLSHKKTKPCWEVLGGSFLPSPGLVFSLRWQGGCPPVLPPGTRFEIPRDLWAPPSLHWAGAGPPGGCRCGQPHPHTPDKRLYVPYKESEAADLTSKSTIINLLVNSVILWDLYMDQLASPFTCGVASLSFAYFTIRMRFLARWCHTWGIIRD